MTEQDLLKEFDKLLDDFIDRTFQLSQENLIRDGKVDTGNLLKTGNVNREFLNKKITYPAPYASDVEYGREAGRMPPVESLVKWVQRKVGVKNEKEARQVAWAIAKSIKARGIAASPFLRPALELAQQEYGR